MIRSALVLLFAMTIPAACVPREPSASVPDVAFGADPIGSSAVDWASLLPTDPVAALASTLSRYRQDVRGFTATLVKQERLGTTLHPLETITLAVRERPFAVSMIWQAGIRNQTAATLYVEGENAGAMRVWRPKALLAKTLTVNPTDALPRGASRYAITESSLGHGQERTLRAWKKAQDAGTLHVEYLGKKPVPELNGRECHVLVRKCQSPEFDPFLMGEQPKPKAAESFSTVTIYLDNESGYQIGADLTRADGQRVGAYFFCDLVLNPRLNEGQFSESMWK
jgi:hypothetical protein